MVLPLTVAAIISAAAAPDRLIAFPLTEPANVSE
jgi:hypothetical protein